MHRSILGSMAAAAGLMGALSATAQTVEFRIVERQGQMSVPVPVGTTATTDAVLNFAVQARVVGGVAGTAISTYSFNIHIVGEAEANGTLNRLLISNTDGTYAANPNQTVNNTIGRGGLPAPYTYLAGIGRDFNGLINVSSGTFINTPDQEIGHIVGVPVGGSMLLVTDANGDGNPDTYTGPAQPVQGAVAALDPVLGATYFGVGGGWLDVYRFRYAVSNTAAARVLHIVMDGPDVAPSVQVFTEWAYENGTWGPRNPVNAGIVVGTLDVPVGTVTGACCQRNVCSVLDQGACNAGHGQFRGVGVACLPSGTTNACCVGNYNGENGLGVQDIFDFLSSWFAGDLRADIDENGVLNVYDIFAFLGAWRNGC